MFKSDVTTDDWEYMADDYVTISRETYSKLLRAEHNLKTLEAYGVENWDGYPYALPELLKEQE
jgi:hypothetical protein